MRTPRRAWMPSLPLTWFAAFAVASPLALTGCQKIKGWFGKDDPEASGGEGEGEGEDDEPAAGGEGADSPLSQAEQAGLPSSALAAPGVPQNLTNLDDLLTLVPKVDDPNNYKGVVLVRDASVFLDYADEGAEFIGEPLQRLAKAAKGNPEFKELAGLGLLWPMAKGQFDQVRGTIEGSGVHLDKGMILSSVDDRTYIIYAADKPDALAQAVAPLDEDFESMKCQALEAPAGYVVCADSDKELAAYAPGGTEGAAALRGLWAKQLAGVDLDRSNIIADIAEEGVRLAVETPPGLMLVSMVAPADEEGFKDLAQGLQPGAPQLLRGVQPGAGFMWFRFSEQVLRDEMLSDLEDNQQMPPSVKTLAEQLNGEVLLAGHYEPAAVALQFGLRDDGAWPEVAKELEVVMKAVRKDLTKELAVEGGKWDIGMVDIPAGAGTVKALHGGLSGVPEADVLAQYTGLTIDGWLFASNDALHVALGASAEAIGRVAAHEAEQSGPSEELLAYLPESLSKSLSASEVGMVVHLPLDSMHSPQTRELVKVALKEVEGFDAELPLAILALATPISSATIWSTHGGEGVQLHFAIQGIGHRGDDEGKAALAAALAVAQGAGSDVSFAPLVEQYPNSPRIASYRARAGQTPAALVASGVGALAVAGAVAVPMFIGGRNEAIADELKVDPEAEDKAKEDSKREPTPAPKPTPRPDPKPTPSGDDGGDDGRSGDDGDAADDRPQPSPGPKPTPGPAPTPSGDDDSKSGDDDKSGDGDERPTRPRIIRKK